MKKITALLFLSLLTIVSSVFIAFAAPIISLNLITPVTVCSTGNDTARYTVSATEIPANTNIVIYQSADSTFNPYLGQGDSIGFIPGNSIPRDTVNFGNCVKILGEFIDACGPSGQEGRNEYIILTSGKGIKVSNLGIDFSSQNNSGAANADINTGATPCGYKTPAASLISGLQLGSCNASNVIPASPADSIPPNAIILLFTSDSVSAGYSINGLCNLGYPIYVLQSACVRTIGAFTNAPRCDAPSRYRTTLAIDKRQNCQDNFTYDLCSIYDKDGTYAIRQQGTDTASVANNGIRRNVIDSCGGIDYTQLNFSADTTLKFRISTNFCNTGYHYIKAVTHPNGTQPVSNTIKYQLVCNDITAVSSTTNICSGDSAKINISTTDPNATLSWTVSGGANITGASAGTGNSINQVLTNTGNTKDSVTYTAISSDAGCTKTQTVKVVVNASVQPQITGNLVICNGNPTTLTAIGQFDSLRWSTGVTTASINVNQAQTYTVTAYKNGCSGIARVTTSSTNVSISISGNAQICNGDNPTLVATGTFDSVRWSSGVLGNQITVSVAGSYTATGYLNGCSAATTVRVTQCSSSVDTLYVCEGDSVGLNGPAGYEIYNWNPTDGLNNSTIQNPNASPDHSTLYVVDVYSPSNELIVNGNFQQGNTGFSSEYQYTTFNNTEGQYFIGTNPSVWNPGMTGCSDHTTGSTNMMCANGAPIADKKVWCETVNVTPNTDYAFSTWLATLTPGNLALLQFSINDVVLQQPFQAPAVPCNWQNFYTIWNSGINTTANICVVNKNTLAGANDFALDDISFRSVALKDSVYVVVVPTPTPVISGTLNFCQGSFTTLTVGGGQFDSVRWNTGATTASIQVSQQGTYSVTAYSKGCSGTTSVQVVSLPLPSGFSIGNDTAYCGNFTKVLSTGVQATQWNTNVTAAQITVTSAGTYIATISNNCGSVSDTIVILQNELPIVNIGNDTTICEGELILRAPEEMRSYVWSTGAQSNTITVSAEGVYSVKITDGNGCVATDSIIITSNCNKDLWLPNAFTPNKDGVNDVFYLRGNPRNTTIEKFVIYNRWGNKVFEANNILPDDKTKGWDGTYKSEPAQFEEYGYYIVARFSNGEKKTLKGNVTLLK